MKKHIPNFSPSKHFMDKAIKWILSSPHHLRELLNFLAPNWAEMLDFATLKKLDPSLISREFRESIRDALFLIQCKEGNRSVVLHFLLEHQSRPAREIRFRFQKSQMGTWTLFEERQRSLEEKDPYPPIVPLLIYTGKDNWEVPGLKEYCSRSPLSFRTARARTADVSRRTRDLTACV